MPPILLFITVLIAAATPAQSDESVIDFQRNIRLTLSDKWQRGELSTRFVRLFHEAWHQHGSLKHDLTKNRKATNRGCTASIRDLKQRGLLDNTRVIWCGEFGRTLMVQDGGVKQDIAVKNADNFGFHTVQDKVHVRDLHATILQLLRFGHQRISVKPEGLDQRITRAEHTRVVEELLA